MSAENKKGKVYLVGAGPGDPGLITLKARRCIKNADVVVYDHLANSALLKYAKKTAELIYVGKQGCRHTLSQHKINTLITSKALQGLNVVRLKGGDPFIFGRGGEEAQELGKAGVSFEVVPGITSATAVPAYAGIPLTHREYASSVAFVTGHEDPAKKEPEVSLDKLATGAGTLVFLMGVGNLSQIVENLMRWGRAPETPVAFIHKGTVAEQKTVIGSLHNIARKVQEAKLTPPAIIVVGEVVRLRDELNWFERKPLFGRRIVITRAREQASDLFSRLSELGAECIEFPSIEIIPPSSWVPMDGAIRSLHNYQWIIFTSVNGVRYFFQRLEALGKDTRDLKGIKVGAIGPKTAEAVKQKGIRPDLVPEEYRAEAVVQAFKEQGGKEERVLLPRAARAREVLPEELRKICAGVDVVEAYRTVKPDVQKQSLWSMLERGEIHMVTFTSSSTVENFVDMFEPDKDQLLRWMHGVAVACIGPVTATTAKQNGLKVSLVSPEYTIDSLVEAIVDYFSRRGADSSPA